jgi:translation elongation factor EF-Ts
MEGRVFSYIHFNGQVGSLIKIATVTDFAARTDEFLAFGKDMAMQVAMTNPATVDELLKEASIKVENVSVGALVDAMTKTLGEKIDIMAFERYSFKK